ncbi:hypothetical protein E6W39_11115 [Kitasatospora acidiphila]|uniref:Uncharacterized protein n=1 Tax=Kitasatospora acidiphila TaxID=2567942 RepID=A0A540W168_9ACTN|nr:hypothetical protein E6W39_11115 [Kitasatospora acidiphila]
MRRDLAGVRAAAGSAGPSGGPGCDRLTEERRVRRGGLLRASPAYLCTAGVGYDDSTGLGTPNGLAAFTG